MSRKEDMDNRANQMNPNNDAYWTTRGYDERPHDWEGRSTSEGERKDQRVVTEFIRSKVNWQGNKVEGIRYASSVNEGHVSYLLFADQSNVAGTDIPGWPEDRWLRLADARSRRFDPAGD